jgi:hypothetical protein
MPTLSGLTSNIRGVPPPDIQSNREPSEVMSELVAEFIRQSAYSEQALLYRSLAHTRNDPQQDYASLQGEGLKTAPVRGVSCILDSADKVLVESNFIQEQSSMPRWTGR